MDDFCLQLGIRLRGNNSLQGKIVTKTHAFLGSDASRMRQPVVSPMGLGPKCMLKKALFQNKHTPQEIDSTNRESGVNAVT